jgi:hypothetical protein
MLGAALVLAGSAVVAGPASAASTGSTYVSLAVPHRAVDTRTGADGNHKGAVSAGRGIAPMIGGKGGVPSSASAVAVTISAVSPTASGGIVGYVGTRPATTNLQFTSGHSASDTAILPLSGGRLSLFNTASRGTVQMVVDVSGYYVAAAAAGPGSFHTVTPRRAVDTTTGAGGNHRGALGADRGIAPSFNLSNAGVPSTAGAVAVTITALNVKKAGSIIAYRPDEPKQNLALLHVVPGQRSSAFAVLRISGNRVSMVNMSGGTVDVQVDVSGYYDIGFAQAANAFQTVVQTRVRTGGAVAANTSVKIPIAGKGGIPLTNVAAALVTVHVLAPGRSGSLQVLRPDQTRPNGMVLQFSAGQTTSNVVFAPVSGGAIEIHNWSGGSLTLVVDTDGYVPSTAVSAPATTSTARYVRNITDSATANATVMTSEGTADAGNAFVLLDIGAQLNDRTGVALSVIDRRITYENLVIALNTYLDAYAAHGGHGTVAVGTNNAGDWSSYTDVKRGTDWATEVIDQLHVPAGGSVVGAADFEAGFASTEPQAETWKANFLNHVPGTDTALVFIGSADFCPKTWTSGAACNFGWTYQKLYALAGGSRTVALPQVYFGYMATEWAEIDATGGRGLQFLGSLTEFGSDDGTLTAAQGWSALRRAVASVTNTSIGTVSADLHVDG